jgi:hypothetical protein
MEDRDVAYEIGEELTRDDLEGDIEVLEDLIKQTNEALYLLSGSCRRALKHLISADAAIREAIACIKEEL